jgi:hypothetical protein
MKWPREGAKSAESHGFSRQQALERPWNGRLDGRMGRPLLSAKLRLLAVTCVYLRFMGPGLGFGDAWSHTFHAKTRRLNAAGRNQSDEPELRICH